MQKKKRETLPFCQIGAASPCDLAIHVVGTSREIPLPSGPGVLRLGSDPTNQVVIDDRYASAFHCALEWQEPGRLVLKDLGSRNGTFLNGMKVLEGEVRPGARIVLGATLLIVHDQARRTASSQALVGRDPKFRAVIELAIRVASSPCAILLCGESGTGKELLARLIHDHSQTPDGPFVAVNCGAIARDLIESELFGHERGAFTGAVEKRSGLFEQADGGTLFLDEIGELPREQQPRLLRALETHRIRRVGGQAEREVRVRIVAATHRNLLDAAKLGEFRLDLYYRLAQLELEIPPLRDRPGDIDVLAQHFLAEASIQHGLPAPGNFLAMLPRHSWPGNVRELRNAVHRAVILGDWAIGTGRALDQSACEDVALQSRAAEPGQATDGSSRPHESTLAEKDTQDRKRAFSAITRADIEAALLSHGSCRKAAAALGLSKSTLFARARRFGIPTRRQ